jgi:hypothetical protein
MKFLLSFQVAKYCNTMKIRILICLLLFAASLPAQETAYSLRTRLWSNKDKDDGSIIPIGNGVLMVYEQGPDIIQVFGPPYSAPSSLQLLLNEEKRDLKVKSRREKNTAVWHHNVYVNDTLIAEMVDYIVPGKGIFIRDIDAKKELYFKAEVPANLNAISEKSYFDYITNTEAPSVLINIPKGTTYFASDPVAEEHSLFVTATGNTDISEPVNGLFQLTVKSGKSRIILSGSTSYPETVKNTEDLLKNPGTNWLEQSRKYWYDFSSRRLNFESMIPSGNPLKDTLLDAIDNISVLIKTQQSSSGGVMAGHYYNMAYVRDQSGVMRGLLALGYTQEAKAILDFWLHKFRVFGNIVNADAMGTDVSRLFFVNDEVEVPAYLILDCFEYYKYTKDNEFLKQAFPMMQWAFEIQLGHLVEGMTEFSGDETYIAGGTFPNGNIYQGSAESTLLFITGGEKFLDWVSGQHLWSPEKIEKYRRTVADAKEKYKGNFMESSVLYANNPLREKIAGSPRFRYGWCQVHSPDQKYPAMTWLEREEKGRYICADCRKKVLPEFNLDHEKRYVLNSVNLVPLYIGSNLFTKKEIAKILNPGIEIYKVKGSIPSNLEGNRSLGYDYGLFLYNMIKLDDPFKEQVLKKTLSVIDPTGAWVEYYDNDKPFNCRARPWESAINIEAIIEYINSL